ncbi:MAG: hypothetical protein G01um101429_840 [Parcubacteria group bacterium Gr01-1014_29]|nr:MAG: hypothetical protein G01um101429_840 [Parcubacteria group bacterium Gr01-1014_29]
MIVSISKSDLEQKLEETELLFNKAKNKQERTVLRERAYWLRQTIDNEDPASVLERAYMFWKKTNGSTGLEPPEPEEPKPAQANIPAISNASDITVQRGDTLWGILYRELEHGERLDDRQIADIFKRLPPAAQTHFIDAVEDRIHTLVEEEMRIKSTETGTDKTTSFRITNTNALPVGASITLDPVLRNEAELLHLVEKTKEIASVKEKLIQENSKKISDWLHYHQIEPKTELKLEEVLFGQDTVRDLAKEAPDEIRHYIRRAEQGADLPVNESAIVAEWLPLYERNIRDRLLLSTAAYVRARSLSVEELLEAVPADSKQIALVAKSVVRRDILSVPEDEFWKRVRIAQIIRAYTFGKELRLINVRQFFRSIVE